MSEQFGGAEPHNPATAVPESPVTDAIDAQPAQVPGTALTGPRSEKPVALALQGGGAHGAFTWGVLDALIEDGRLGFEAVTGASAGAMNAVVLVDGWLKGGPDGAREGLERFWREVSPRTYFGRITEPILIHHGTSDDSCPIEWTHRTTAALHRRGKDVRLFVYEGEEHAFGPQWPLSMERTVRFLRRHLNG